MKKLFLITMFLFVLTVESTLGDFKKILDFVIRDASSGKVYFTGEDLRRDVSGKIEVQRYWFNTKNDTAYIEKALYDPKNFQIDWVKIENRVTKEAENIVRSGNRYTIKTVDENAKKTEKTINVDKRKKIYHPVVLGHYATFHYNEILKEKLNFELIVSDRGRTFDFYFENKSDATIDSQKFNKIVMEGRNIIVRTLAPDIFFYFQMVNGEPVLKRYIGILLMPIDGEKEKRIEIEYNY